MRKERRKEMIYNRLYHQKKSDKDDNKSLITDLLTAADNEIEEIRGKNFELKLRINEDVLEYYTLRDKLVADTDKEIKKLKNKVAGLERKLSNKNLMCCALREDLAVATGKLTRVTYHKPGTEHEPELTAVEHIQGLCLNPSNEGYKRKLSTKEKE